MIMIPPYKYAEAVRLVVPVEAHFKLDPESYEGLEMLNGYPKPSKEEIETAWENRPPETPPPVTRRQLKRWLYAQGLLNSVPALIATIADDDARSLAQIDWDDAATFDADNPLVLTFAAALGMTREQLHAAWIEAAQIL